MDYIEIYKHQRINLDAKDGATPTQAINSAIEFCKEHEVKECDLYYFGFTFGIEQDSDINKLVSYYKYWLNNKNKQRDGKRY